MIYLQILRDDSLLCFKNGHREGMAADIRESSSRLTLFSSVSVFFEGEREKRGAEECRGSKQLTPV